MAPAGQMETHSDHRDVAQCQASCGGRCPGQDVSLLSLETETFRLGTTKGCSPRTAEETEGCGGSWSGPDRGWDLGDTGGL